MEFWRALLVVSAWSALLAATLTACLVLAEERVMGGPVIPHGALALAVWDGALKGTMAGALGQALFSVVLLYQNAGPAGSPLGRFFGLALAGAVLARLLSCIIPFMLRRMALQVGAVGGVLAAVAFYHASVPEQRLWVAAILGAAVGILICLPGRQAGGKDRGGKDRGGKDSEGTRGRDQSISSSGQIHEVDQAGREGKNGVRSPEFPHVPEPTPRGGDARVRIVRPRTTAPAQRASTKALRERQVTGESVLKPRSLATRDPFSQ